MHLTGRDLTRRDFTRLAALGLAARLAPALNAQDANSYDLHDAFDFGQVPLAPVSMVATPVPATSAPFVNFSLPQSDADS